MDPNWLIFFFFLVGTVFLLDKAKNWAGMTGEEALDLTVEFSTKYETINVGFPPHLLEVGMEKHDGVTSAWRGVIFFLLNVLLGAFFIGNITDVGRLLIVMAGTLVFELLVLIRLAHYNRRFYETNHRECMKLHAAEGRLTGRLIDHNAHKRSIPLPKNGRIMTLIVEVKYPHRNFFDAGHYEIDLWLPKAAYGEVFYGALDLSHMVTVFISACHADPEAPANVPFKIVGAHRKVFAQLILDDIEPVKNSLRPVEPEVMDLSFDEYAFRRGSREANC